MTSRICIELVMLEDYYIDLLTNVTSLATVYDHTFQLQGVANLNVTKNDENNVIQSALGTPVHLFLPLICIAEHHDLKICLLNIIDLLITKTK